MQTPDNLASLHATKLRFGLACQSDELTSPHRPAEMLIIERRGVRGFVEPITRRAPSALSLVAKVDNDLCVRAEAVEHRAFSVSQRCVVLHSQRSVCGV